MEEGMKSNLRVGPVDRENKKTFEIDSDTLIDIMERINGLSFEGQCQIVAYLKSLIARGYNGLKPYERYFELKSIR
jgi:hypothetical protein